MFEKYTKEQLLEEFFETGNNGETEKIKIVEEKIKRYRNKNGYDKQVEDVLLLIKMFKSEAKFSDFEESSKIVFPILERARIQIDLDLTDIRIMATAVSHTKNYRQSFLLGEKLLRYLEKYSNHYKHPRIQMVVHSGVSSRLVRSKYYDNVSDYEELRKYFLLHIEKAIGLCKKEKFKDFLGVNVVMKGIFLGDFDIVQKGLSLAAEYGNHALYEMLLLMIKEYKSFIEFPITTAQLKTILGKNIKMLRKANKISVEELSDMLGIASSSTLRHIERGSQEPSIVILLKLSKIFNVSINSLFQDSSNESLQIDSNSLKLNEIRTMIMKLDAKELKYFESMLRQMLDLRKE
ncbi:MAG: helix-turn-helix domain-containing protein [Defluviitaleaceae bacterium]|nr:helix-turn-helix domain-containing protein [Defluviitaleaceae bacterium]